MSNYVDEIIKHIKDHPDQWTMVPKKGPYMLSIQSDDVVISNYGNSPAWFPLSTSIIDATVEGTNLPITQREREKLEKAVRGWLKQVNFLTLTEGLYNDLGGEL